MAFDLPDGKKARNIQEQVAFLTEKVRDLIAVVNEQGLKKIEIVEELPEVGSPTILYLVAKEDPDTGDYYDEYLWIDDAWEQIGTTHIDLSDYCTLSTEQTLTGKKTFDKGILIKDSDIGGSTWGIVPGSSLFYLKQGAAQNTYYIFETSQMWSQTIKPTTTNQKDLGTSSYAWKDLYLASNINFTNAKLLTTATPSLLIQNASGTNKYALDVGTTGGLRPLDSFDLGSSSNKWKDLYLSGKSYYGGTTEYINGTAGNAIALYTNSNLTFSFYYTNTYSYSNLLPSSNNVKNLGGSDYRWHHLYIGGMISDGTNSASVETLVKKTKLYKHTITEVGKTQILEIINTTSDAITDISQAFDSAINAVVIDTYWRTPVIGSNVGGGVIYISYLNTSGTKTDYMLTVGSTTDTVLGL